MMEIPELGTMYRVEIRIPGGDEFILLEGRKIGFYWIDVEISEGWELYMQGTVLIAINRYP